MLISELKKGDKFVIIEGQLKRNGIFTFVKKRNSTITATKDGKQLEILMKKTMSVHKYVAKTNLMVMFL